MNRIQKYFNLLAQRIAVDAEMAGSSSSHRPDIGSNRERIVELFLHNHLPRRLSASVGGQVVGYEGSESKQIDIIVSSDISIRFDENEKTFVTAESVAAAISVKSYLDKSALEDSLFNIASIPQIHPDVLRFKLLMNNPFTAFIELHPSTYVFAYKGMDLDTCLDHAFRFYQGHTEIPRNRYPLGIIVNNDYIIKYCRSDTRTTTGALIKAGTFFPIKLEQEMRGYPLIEILNNISSYTDWLPYMDVGIRRYFNASFGLPNE